MSFALVHTISLIFKPRFADIIARILFAVHMQCPWSQRLKPDNLDSEILSSNDFNIYRRDRTDRTGGGVLLAVRENILSMGRRDLESKADILVCEFIRNRERR